MDWGGLTRYGSENTELPKLAPGQNRVVFLGDQITDKWGAGEPEFFTLYETISPRTVTGPDYLARLNDPTPWTRATIPYFRNVARSLCEVAATFGEGQGGLIATFRYAIYDAHAVDHRKRMTQVALPSLAEARGRLSHRQTQDPTAYERANYIRTLQSWGAPAA